MAASVVVKQEPVEFVDFEAKVLELCKENPKGITDTIIQDNLPNITPQQRVKGINRLLSTVRIGTFSFSFGFLFFIQHVQKVCMYGIYHGATSILVHYTS